MMAILPPQGSHAQEQEDSIGFSRQDDKSGCLRTAAIECIALSIMSMFMYIRDVESNTAQNEMNNTRMKAKGGWKWSPDFSGRKELFKFSARSGTGRAETQRASHRHRIIKFAASPNSLSSRTLGAAWPKQWLCSTKIK